MEKEIELETNVLVLIEASREYFKNEKSKLTMSSETFSRLKKFFHNNTMFSQETNPVWIDKHNELFIMGMEVLISEDLEYCSVVVSNSDKTFKLEL